MTQFRRPNPLLTLFLAAAPVVIAATAGSAATISNIPTWYAGLAKPFFTPPNWLFGPAWTTLYVLMIISFWRILMAEAPQAARRRAIIAFLVQIALNGLWSIVFFGLHAPLGALFVIGAMLAAIVVTIIAFRPIDRLAAWLLAPYLGWVSFATALNAGVWWLNH